MVVGVYAFAGAGLDRALGEEEGVPALVLALPVGVVMMVAAPFVGARLSGHPRPMVAGAVAEGSAFGAFLFTAIVWDIPPATILASGLAAGLSIAYKDRGELLARGAVLIGFTILAQALGDGRDAQGFYRARFWIVALLLVVPMTVAGGRALNSLRGNKPKPPDEGALSHWVTHPKPAETWVSPTAPLP